MPTFRKVEIVDAREFSGGDINTNSLVLWIQFNEGRAEYRKTGGYIIDHIRVYAHHASLEYEMAFPGDWIERRQNGTFQVTRQQVIDTYEEV